MGRLFWKFFFFIWLAQLATILGMAALFFTHEQRDEVREHTMRPIKPPPNGPQPPDFSRHPPPPPGIPQFSARPAHLPLLPLVVSTFASLAFAALLAWYFAKPIRQLRAAMAAAATGDLETRLAPTMRRNDELADLGWEFDRMASQLQSLMESQRRLLHDVSHELRSPLARLQAATGLLRQQPEKTNFCIERIEHEGVRMNQLVGELLTLSRLEAGITGNMEEEVAIDELLADIVEDARFEAEVSGRNIGLKNLAGTLLRGNSELLHRAIENVVRNALLHTPEGAGVEVELRLRENESKLELTIEDEGTGVPETALQNIFEPFFRASPSDYWSGHGLGLAIARRVVEAHGGRISAVNRPTCGLRVTLMLPAISR